MAVNRPKETEGNVSTDRRMKGVIIKETEKDGSRETGQKPYFDHLKNWQSSRKFTFGHMARPNTHPTSVPTAFCLIATAKLSM